MSEWISIDEKLPETEGKVIVHCPSADPRNPLVAMAWYHPEEGRWSLLPESWIRGIRHWMPLPEPPDA